MDTTKIPPDPGLVSRSFLEAAVAEASDTPVFRCALRERPDVIANLSTIEARSILRSCHVENVSAKTDEEAREGIWNYLKSFEISDEEWKLKQAKSGTKRQPDIISSVATHDSKSRGKAPMEWGSESVDEKNVSVTSGSLSGVEKSLSATLRRVNDGIGSAVSALAEAAGLLQLVCQSRQPSKEKIQESLNRIQLACASSQGLQVGLNACIDVLNLPGTCDPLSQVAHTPTKPTPAKQSLVGERTYASAAKSISKKSPSKQANRNKLIRKQIAEERSKTRCDMRSIRLKSIAPSGVINNGVLARAFCAKLNFPGREREIIEDIRIDNKGCYYVQIREEHFNEVLSLLGKITTNGGIISMPDLGKWQINEPVKSCTAGKRPIVVYGIPEKTQDQAFVQELWSSNRFRWNIGTNDNINDHLACPSRLNRRSPNFSGSIKDSNAWLPSRNYKVFVSNSLFQQLTSAPNKSFVCYDYNYLKIQEFNEKKRFCDNCGRFGKHCSAVCRAPTKCRHCGEAHTSSSCPNKEANSSRSPRKEEGSSSLSFQDEEFHDCANSISSSESAKERNGSDKTGRQIKASGSLFNSNLEGRMPLQRDE